MLVIWGEGGGHGGCRAAAMWHLAAVSGGGANFRRSAMPHALRSCYRLCRKTLSKDRRFEPSWMSAKVQGASGVVCVVLWLQHLLLQLQHLKDVCADTSHTVKMGQHELQPFMFVTGSS
eukprot:365288-Chlamydomonas_euryale.AAC.10